MRSGSHFDFVACSAQAYQFVWDNRVQILQMSALLLAVKILFFVMLVVFGLEGNMLREGLFSVPLHAFEGFVIAQILVMALYDQDSTGGQAFLPPPQDIERNIKASMIIYVLGELCMSFLVGMTMLGAEESANVNPQSAPDMSFQEFTAIILVLGVVIWGFRFFWMYVPVIMGRHPLDYLKIFSGFSSSFLLIGVWLLCLVPISLVMLVLSEVFGLDLMGVSDGSVALNGVSMAVLAVFDYFMVLVASLAVAFGVASVYRGDNEKTSLF